MIIPSVRCEECLDRLVPLKPLGQHFLFDPGICRRIAASSGSLTAREVVEVGPGPGGLTRALLDSGLSRLVAVEVDHRAVHILRQIAGRDRRLEVAFGDATRVELRLLVRKPRRIVANLPYNVGTSIVIALLRDAAEWEGLTVMLQQEVAERLCASPGTSSYGRLSVLAQWLCVVDLRFRLPPGAFHPPPKVWSALVDLVPRGLSPTAGRLSAMEAVTAAAFGQRRKMLRSALNPLGGADLLLAADIDPSRRAETLRVSEFEALAALVESGSVSGQR